MTTKALRDWVPRVSSYRDASHLQEPVDAIRDLQRAGGGPKYPGAAPFDHGIGRVVAAGPNGEADLAGAAYWIQRLAMKSAAFDAVPDVQEDTSEQLDKNSPPSTFPAVHLPERYAGTHGLGTDGSVEVFFWADFDSGSTTADPQKHYLFVALPATGVRLKIVSILSGGSKYGVQRVLPPAADISLSGDAAVADLGADDGVTVLGVDTNELGRAAHSHLNAVGQVVDGELVHVNADGTRVYTFAAAPGQSARFEVTLSTDGGTDGNSSTAPTYTYTVTALNGETLGTTIGVDWTRQNGTFAAATKGVAYYTSAGALVLAESNEVRTVTACP
jgi:hypothetical protein